MDHSFAKRIRPILINNSPVVIAAALYLVIFTTNI